MYRGNQVKNEGYFCMNQKIKWILGLVLLSAVGNIYAATSADFQNRYQLKEVVVLSRHNIRSPLSGNGSVLEQLTPHAWFKWTSGPSELSLRGGELETLMGQYFRQWLVSEKLMQNNETPSAKEMRFYANSMQRTLATAQYFSSGMLPVANVRIEHRYKLNHMDPVFNPQLTYVSEPFKQAALSQIQQMGGEKGLTGVEETLQDSYALLEKVLDLKDSPLAKKEGKEHFQINDTQIILNLNAEPAMKGSFKMANQASDAFILQYYEEPDVKKAAFGETLTQKDWEQIARIKDVYGDVLFTAPVVAVNVAHPLLKLIRKELARKHRKFTFLCGHDSNIASVLTALEVVPYEAPKSIERKTPIGSKLVFSKWAGKDGQEYVSLNLIYQTAEQLRNRTMLSLENPPMVLPLQLKGLIANADGLYRLEDVQQRFTKAIKAYRDLKKLKADK